MRKETAYSSKGGCWVSEVGVANLETPLPQLPGSCPAEYLGSGGQHLCLLLWPAPPGGATSAIKGSKNWQEF